MKQNNIINIKNSAEDFLTEFLRSSARKMLQEAIEYEVNEFIEQNKVKRLESGKQRVVRNGYLPERNIQTGIGSIELKVPRIRDRNASSDKVEFYLSWIPKYMRRTPTLESMIPLLYLKGISSNNFQSILEPILGPKAANLSPSVISKMKNSWFSEYEAFTKKEIINKKYVYWWVDGIYLSVRNEDQKSCVLVIIGADESGRKELVALVDGFKESTESWSNVLRDLKERGLEKAPNLAIGDGALGFWAALSRIYPETKHQRCWVHKTRNVIDKLPKALQSKAKYDLKQIYYADTRNNAQTAYNKFIKDYGIKYPKVALCLEKDKDNLLSFYDFPAEHWQSIRTTNPIESSFASVRHRTKCSKGCFSRETILATVFKLLKEAEKRWLRLVGQNRFCDIINLVPFIDGKAQLLVEQNKQTIAA